MIVSWRLDGDDRLVGVGLDWEAFAEANDGGECLPPPVGLSLDQFVSGPELHAVWKAVLRRARSIDGHQLDVTYRCDAPEARRRLQATATLIGPHDVEIVSHVAREEARPDVPLLDHHVAERSDELIRMCSWCARIWADAWVDIECGCDRLGLLEEAHLPQITHTVCPDCLAGIADDLETSPSFLPGNRRHFSMS